jgi:lysophospholipase L1-like esterase
MILTRRAFCRALAATPLACVLALRLLCFGDSITSGAGASTPALAYASLVAAALGRQLDNRAIGASLIERQLREAIRPAVIARTDVVLFVTGYNDMRAGTPLDRYRPMLAEALALLRASGALVVVGTCPRMTEAGYAAYGPEWNHGSDQAVAAYNVVIAETATRYGCRIAYTERMYDPWNVTSDMVHPNDRGHQQIAQAMLEATALRITLPLVVR